LFFELKIFHKLKSKTMRMQIVRGSFCWDGENFHNGLVCLCHAQPGDFSSEDGVKEDLIPQLGHEIYSRRINGEKIIFVPFTGLDVRQCTLRCDAAIGLFWLFSQKFPEFIHVPFDRGGNEFLLHVGIKQIVKFVEI